MSIRRNLLEIVQDLLASVEDDEVNSINDTETATRVANIVKECYYEIISAGDLPEHYNFFELEASGDVNKPTLMTLPDGVVSIQSLKYNMTETSTVEFRDLRFVPLDIFMERMYNLDDSEDNVTHWTHVISGSTIDFLVKNDKTPEYYTTFDDNTLVFDSFVEDQETFLQKGKTLGYGQVFPVFSMTDEYIPDLDAKQFSLLINEAKRQVYNELRQSENPLAAQRARKAWIRLQRDKRAVPFPYNHYDELPNYGRRTR
jgi:hypothetical protein